MKLSLCRNVLASGAITTRSSAGLASSARRIVPARGFGLDLNISSIRSVTRKPPTMLIVPNATAITSSTLLNASQPGEAEQQQAAEQHDPVDRVRARHQRRVQGVRAPWRSPRSR